MTAATDSKAPGPYGKSTVYRGKSGQWAFVLHRVTGFLVFMFLLLHIVDVSLINIHHGQTYNEVHRLYGNIVLRLFEVGLLFGLVYHSLNGLADRDDRLLPGRGEEPAGAVQRGAGRDRASAPSSAGS